MLAQNQLLRAGGEVGAAQFGVDEKEENDVDREGEDEEDREDLHRALRPGHAQRGLAEGVEGVLQGQLCEELQQLCAAEQQQPAAAAVANASRRFVYGDFRQVDLLGRRNAQESTAQLAAEIVLRTSTW